MDYKLAKLADDNKDLEARAMRVSDENCTLKGKVNVNENFHLKEKDKKLTIEVDDGEDGILLSKLYRKKRLAEVYEGDKKDPHYLKECFASPKLIELGCKGAQGIQTTKTEEVAEKGIPSYNRRNSMNQTRRVYTGRTPSSEQREHAEKRAQILQKFWRSCNPSFIKTMGVSHVSGSFWLNIPVKFCKENLPAYDQQMILQDEEGLESKINYICHSTGFSCGWLDFARAHKLELGGALLFELHGPAIFKVFIIKAIPQESSKDFDHNITGRGIDVEKLTSANSAENQDIDLSDIPSDIQVISKSWK